MYGLQMVRLLARPFRSLYGKSITQNYRFSTGKKNQYQMRQVRVNGQRRIDEGGQGRMGEGLQGQIGNIPNQLDISVNESTVDQLVAEQDNAASVIGDKLIERLQQLKQQQINTQLIIDGLTGNYPIKLLGYNDLNTPSNRFSYLVNRIMSYWGIAQHMVTDYLKNIFKATLHALSDNNMGFINEYIEPRLANRLLQANRYLAERKGWRLRLTTESNITVKEQCSILDSVCVRGLSMDRKTNGSRDDYVRRDEKEEVGLINFIPKRITQDSQEFQNPAKNKKVYQGYEQMVLRVLVRIKTPYRLELIRDDQGSVSSNQPPLVPSQLQSYQHVCVFQNTLMAPKHLQSRYKLQTLIEWLGKYRFGSWHLVDIDNCLHGNMLFDEVKQQVRQGEELDEVFRRTVMDKDWWIDVRNV